MIQLAEQTEVDHIQKKLEALAIYLGIVFVNQAHTHGYDMVVRPIATSGKNLTKVEGTTIYD